MKVAAYIRVSTDEQADKGNSLNEQQERLAAYCIAMGWQKPHFFIDDGYSAKNLKRPAMQKMIKSVEKNLFDIVLTAKLDRLCRNLLELLQLVKLFEDHKCNYVSSSEGFDTTTAAGKMVLQILGAFAEFERGRNSERVKDNMISLAKNTSKALGKTCYGYNVIDGEYQINEEEAKHVRYMFELAEQGHGHRMIAKYLNGAGITTRQGKAWDQVNVKRLITNKTLMGTNEYNKRDSSKDKVEIRDKTSWIIKENNHPAIITPEQFESVQNKLRSRSIAHKHAENESYILTGLVKCKHCGGNMKGSTSRMKRPNKLYTYHKYICSSYVLGYGCKHHAVHRDDIESGIIDRVKEIAKGSTKPINIKVSLSKTLDEEIKSINLQLSKLDKKIQKQIEAYEEDLITRNDLKAATDRVEAERIKLNEQLSKLANRSGNTEDLKRTASNLIEDITGIDRIKAKNALRELIDKIEVEGEVIDITWKV